MLKKLTTTFLAFSFLGMFTMENPALASTYNPDTRATAFENEVKSINAGHDPVIKSITTIKVDGHSVRKMAWSPDGLYLAAILTKNNDVTSVIIISLDQNKVIKELPLTEHSYFEQAIAFSPDGRYLAASGLNFIRLWDAKTWTEIRDIEGANEKDPYTPLIVTSLVFSPDSQYLACLFPHSFWWPKNETRRGKIALQEAYEKIEQSKSKHTFLQDLDAGVIGEEYVNAIVAYNVTDGKKIFYFRAPKFQDKTYFIFPCTLAYTADGQYLLNSITKNRYDVSNNHATEYGYLQLRNPKTGDLLREISITSPQNKISTLQEVNGQLFTAVKHQEALDHGTPLLPTDPIRLWNEDFSSPVKEFKSGSKGVTSFSVSQNGKILISFYGSRLEIWDAEKNELLKQMIVNDRYSADCLVSPNGKVIAVTDMDKHLVRFIRLK